MFGRTSEFLDAVECSMVIGCQMWEYVLVGGNDRRHDDMGPYIGTSVSSYLVYDACANTLTGNTEWPART